LVGNRNNLFLLSFIEKNIKKEKKREGKKNHVEIMNKYKKMEKRIKVKEISD